jgi:hypothetical protein
MAKCQQLHDDVKNYENALMGLGLPSSVWKPEYLAQLDEKQELAQNCERDAKMCLKKHDQSSCVQLRQCAWSM